MQHHFYPLWSLQDVSVVTLTLFCVHFPTDTLVLEPVDPVVVSPSQVKVTVMVEVVAFSGAAALYSVDVPKGSSLLEALELLKGKDVGFT